MVLRHLISFRRGACCLVLLPISLYIIASVGITMFMAQMDVKDLTQPLENHQKDYIQQDQIPNVNINSSLQKAGMRRVLARLQRASTLCPNLTRPVVSHTSNHTNPTFHTHKQDDNELYVFSVHFDDRDEVGAVPVLRILVVAPKLQHRPFCYIWYEDLRRPVVMAADVKKNGGGHNVEKVHFEQYLLTCNLTTPYPMPTHISVVTSRTCPAAQNYIPVLYPSIQEEHAVGVCGPLMWGDSVNSNVFRLVEWIEMLRELGATEVTLYVSSVKGMSLPSNSLAALNLYAKEGLVDLRFMPGPKDESSWGNVNAGDPAALNDCMYRNMYRYRYMIVKDTDEVILPRDDVTYPDMLKQIDAIQKVRHPWASYTFRNTYFWLGCDDKSTEPQLEPLYVMRMKTREPNNRFLFGSKSIINPRKCISVFNHYCYIRFPGIEKPFTVDVKTSIAMSNHYRIVHKGKTKEKCQELKEKGISDNVADRYKKRVMPRIKAMLHQVGVSL